MMVAKRNQDPWWVRRWWECVVKGGNGARMARGKSLSRNGMVRDVKIAAGQISALVQGSTRHPYHVELYVKQFLPEDWEAVLDEIAKQAGIGARLLNSELPPDVERIFGERGLPLFPPTTLDIPGSCSCPDWDNPCKHIAAVLHAVGQQLALRPLLLFELHGMTQAECVAGLNRRRSAAVIYDKAEFPATQTMEQLTENSFWQGTAIDANLFSPLPSHGMGSQPLVWPELTQFMKQIYDHIDH